MTPAAISVFTPRSEPHRVPVALPQVPSEQDATRAVHVLRDALADLVKDCDARLAEGTDIHDIAGRLLKAAAAGSAIETDRAQRPLLTRITTLEQELERLQMDVDVERRHAADLTGRLETEKADRVRAETALQEARSITQQIVARYDTQVHALKSAHDAARAELGAVRQQLEAEQAERRRVTTALESVQQAIDTIRPSITPAAAPAAVRPAPLPAKAPALATSQTAASGPAIPEPHPEHVEFLQRLFEEAGAMYRSDVELGLMPIEIVDRLTANLRRVRESMERRFPEPAGAAAAVFQRELTALLDSTGETAFGRHLSIAAHACAATDTAGQKG